MDKAAAISKLYPELRQIARRISGAKPYDDLLHTTLERVLSTPTTFTDINGLRYYCIRAIHHQHRNPTSVYNRTMKPKAQMVEFNPAVHQIPSSWYGSRIDNEVLDFCITLIPDDFDRMVFTMFVLDGFDYTECSKATGIPKQSLQEAVQRSRKFLRRFVRKK